MRLPLQLPEIPTGALTPAGVAQIVARLMPEHAIVSDDSVTSRAPLLRSMTCARPHDYLSLTGGSIGQGLPLALGAALAAPDRKVLCMQGDGGAAYTIQALWSMAREDADVTSIVFANRSYAILNIEMQRVGMGDAGRNALSMLDLGNPELNWAGIATGFGVQASRATTCEEFAAQLASAMQTRGPKLIEARI